MKENEVPQGEGQKVFQNEEFQNEEEVTKQRAIESPGMAAGQSEQPKAASAESSRDECKQKIPKVGLVNCTT